jgi:hypothetical protein
MEHALQQSRSESLGKTILVFGMHQIIGAWGVGAAATLLFNLFLDSLGAYSSSRAAHHLYGMLTATPYFPFQIALGLYLGWVLARRLQHRSMQWIWVLPLAILCYSVIALPTVSPAFTSIMVQSGINQSRFSHYFGWGCRVEDRCFDQLFVTMPFYASAAYSVGSFLAREAPRMRPI